MGCDVLVDCEIGFGSFSKSFIKSDIKGKLSEYIVYGKKKRCGTCLSVCMQYITIEYISS